MIRTIQGRLTHKSTDHVIVNVGGIGYRLYVTLPTFSAVGDAGMDVELFVHTHVREDSFELFGFLAEYEREMFELLISVSRVGPKLARNILSGIEAQQLGELLSRGDVARLSMVPGLGTKTAERMIVELRDKLKKPDADQAPVSDVDRDVVSALINLGYRKSAAERALAKAKDKDPADVPLEERLRQALKLLSKA